MGLYTGIGSEALLQCRVRPNFTKDNNHWANNITLLHCHLPGTGMKISKLEQIRLIKPYTTGDTSTHRRGVRRGGKKVVLIRNTSQAFIEIQFNIVLSIFA